MAVPNEVRVNIRHHILLLKTFTVPQLQAVTGLNRQSIHTEIRRMEKDGLVSRFGTEEGKKEPTGGRPPVIYQLTPDPEKRFEVLQSVRAFYTPAKEQPSEPLRPESKHYFIVEEVLKGVIEKGATLTQEERAARLDEIKKRLEYARQEEEVGEEGTQLIATAFDTLEAKAIDALAGDWERAIQLLGDARRDCRRLGADDLVAEIEAYVVRTIASRMTECQLYSDEVGEYEKVEEMAQNLQIIENRFGDLPEIVMCVKQAERLAAKAPREQQTRLLASALSRMMREMMGQTPGAIEKPYMSEYTGEFSLKFKITSTSDRGRTASASTLLMQDTGYRTEQSPQADDLVQELFGFVQAPDSEKLRK